MKDFIYKARLALAKWASEALGMLISDDIKMTGKEIEMLHMSVESLASSDDKEVIAFVDSFRDTFEDSYLPKDLFDRVNAG